MDAKKNLLNMMNCMDFNIADIGLEVFQSKDGKIHYHEVCGHKMIDCDEIQWLYIEDEGSGFEKLFKGAIARCILYDEV